MNKTGEIPYSWDQIEEQIRDAILCQASILAAFGPDDDGRTVRDYLGLDGDGFVDVQDLTREEIAAIDITRHEIHYHARVAYDYAYQCRPQDRSAVLSTWHEVDGLLQGFPETDADAQPSPFCTLNDFPLRRMLETFFARFALLDKDWQWDMDIRQLSLLANMTVPAVRTSLSKEGFKLQKRRGHARSRLEGTGFTLANADARLWLSRRRGFIPQLEEAAEDGPDLASVGMLHDPDLSFPEAVARIMELRGLDASAAVAKAGLDAGWLDDLLHGRRVAPDIDALRALARTLRLPEPDLAAAGVKHILALETG
ncbi:helix-turn-helix domain-containing protein [Oceanicella actignis]|uniref:helix-turn-helix domain-containing protein n=1 Tax=Oceanicella actignis TaxID=1189325 RepID=UPI0011E6899B|nr:helix-turn-helix transcriptional regulator [Oceanicella actignis]TYO91474.1 helix-turn-helix protein [Oceanicella actignis]